MSQKAEANRGFVARGSGTGATHLGPRMVPLDELLPHPLNSNVMPPDLQAKLGPTSSGRADTRSCWFGPTPTSLASTRSSMVTTAWPSSRTSATARPGATRGRWKTAKRNSSSPR